MKKYESIEEFKKTVQLITEAETNDFFELSDMLGSNPKTDLAGANLNGVNLSGGDLQGANLRHTDLGGADLSQTNLSGADLTKADLSCANLIGANLTATNFGGAKVEDARFSSNQGLSESIKLDLSKRGAIFENSHSQVEDDIEDDINVTAFKKQKRTLLQKYQGEYVAFIEGELKGHDKSEDDLRATVNREYPDQPKLIKKVEAQEKVVYLANHLKST